MSQLGFIGVLISDGPVLETSTSYYQRLVARDDDEAMEIVDESLTEDDWHFIVQATREIVEDLGTRQSPAETPAAVAAAAVVDGQAPSRRRPSGWWPVRPVTRQMRWPS
jgi:hypothetical protein